VTQPLRVAIDLRPLALPHSSGIGLLVAQILEELPALGVEFVGVSDRPVPPGRTPPRVRVRVAEAPGGRILWESTALLPLLRSLEPRPDLFHATWNHGIPERLPFPSILSLHDLIPWRHPDLVPWPPPAFLHRGLYRSAVRAAARAATAVITLSEASRRDIAALLPTAAGKVEVISCAVPRWFRAPSPEDVAAARARFGGAPYWLYLGGFDPRKGIGDLLEALARARAGGAALPPIVFAGALNPEAESCRSRAAALGLAVQFPGYVPDADLAALYAGASLFVYPSRYEGFGIPPLLAMAAGTPLIVSDGGSLPEVVGDAATVVPAGDVLALATALATAAADPTSLEAAAARGRARAKAFTVEALAARTLRAYERAAGRPRESA